MGSNWRKRFLMVWAGQGISIFTSSVFQMAMVWYLTDRTKSAFVLTMATLIGYVPQTVLGPFVGVLIDKWNRKKIMVVSDAFIMLISLLILLFERDGAVPIPIILFVMFARSIGAAFHNPSLQAVTPTLVPKEELTRYAGVSQSVESVSMLLSPGAAAILFSFLDLGQMVFLDVGGAFIAVLLLIGVHIPNRNEQRVSKQESVFAEAIGGLGAIKRVEGLGSLIFISALYAIIYFPIGTLFPLITMDYFRGSFQASGVVETVFSVGMLAGSAILGILGNRLPKAKAISFAIGLYGAGLLITGLLPPTGIAVFVVLSFIMGISIPFYRGVKMAIIQARVEDQYLGRVIALTTSIQTLAMPVGLITAGLFVEVIGVDRWFLISGILSLMIMVVSRLLPSFQRCGDET